ncbi:MAG: hypothetical protein Aureis2KO_03970 [Aureisphaera sp.]
MTTKLNQLKNWGKGIIGSVFKKKDDNGETVKNPYSNIPSPEMFFTKTYTIEAVDEDMEASKTLKKMLSEIAQLGEYFRKVGDIDGQYGVEEKSMLDIVRNAALRTRAYIETIFSGQRDGVLSKLESKNAILEYSKSDFERNDRNLTKIQKAQQWRPNSYSRPLGWIYTMAGLALIIADLILSVQITQQGFELETGVEKWGMALGIAICTIYVKIYFDMYILPSLERSITAFKRENLPGVEDNVKELKRVFMVWKYRFGFNTFLLILCLSTIVVLGLFRFHHFIYSIKTGASLFGWETKWAFILVSLLFPLIGGICSAFGIYKFSNAATLSKAKARFEESKQKFNNAQQEVSLISQRLKNYGSYVSWCSLEGTFIKENTDFFYACYRHGYEYGFQKQTAELDLFDRAREMRKQFAARNARIKTISLSQNNIALNN